jgi:hypothetical protein
MFNIVKRRDFMLGHDLPTRQEVEKMREQYGREYVVVSRTDSEPKAATSWGGVRQLLQIYLTQ